ncbi:MAG: PD-(D/E)XK nuclease family protein [Clostridiales bacterium]|nr:PD-(D/E)XK nuclease family protein [Clostridiales bacterium]
MVCRFILGRAGAGKTRHCLREISRLLRLEPREGEIVFLLPEQSVFIHEQMLAADQGLRGFTGARVAGFAGLAARAGVRPALPVLTESGRLMLLAKILAKKQQDLSIFAAGGANGALISAFKELKTYGVGPEELERAAGQDEGALKSKLCDLSLLYREYCGETEGRYGGAEDALPQLAREIRENGFLAGSRIFVDGFAAFDPPEMAVLQALMEKAQTVEIALALDPTLINRQLGEEHFFYPLWRTYHELLALARKSGVEVPEPLALSGGRGSFFGNEELAFLESNLLPVTVKAVFPEKPRFIRLASAADKKAEVEGAGREILRLVREEGLRYREIGVVVRRLEDYEELIAQVFTELQIPFFSDSKKSLLYHPLAELVRAALEVAAEGWHFRHVFRYLKSGLAPLDTLETARLENYCLANGIRHHHWTSPAEWRFYARRLEEKEDPEGEREHLRRVNELRRRGVAELMRFCRVCREGPITGGVVSAVKGLLNELNVRERLEILVLEERRAGRTERAETHRQAFEGVERLLEQAAALLEGAELSFAQTCAVFEAGFASLRLALIPPALDQVLVSALERSRNPELAACFVLGANEGVLPAKIGAEGVFTGKDREALEQAGVRLAPAANARQFAEYFLLYIALTRSGQRLYVSYALADEDGQSLRPSVAVSRLRALFPSLTEGHHAKEAFPALAGGSATLASLARELRGEGPGNESYWYDIYEWYKQKPAYAPLLEQISRGLSYRAGEDRLRPRTVQRLYGKVCRSSVTRLEKFRQCPFAYFASYGLNLQKRRIYELSAPDSGQFFHAVLADVGRKVATEGRLWRDVDEEKALELAKESAGRFLPELLGNILSSSARYAYLAERMTETVKTSVLLLAEQMRRGEFTQIAWEVDFGPGKPLAPLLVPLPDGDLLQLSGRIDRIDAAIKDGAVWLRVIDYKSGKESLSVQDIYSGKKLQLMVYLLVALQNAAALGAPGAKAAGAYYFPLREEIRGAAHGEEESAFPGLKMNGLTVKELEAILLSDREFCGHSAVIPAALTKDGRIRADSPGVTEEELALLQKHLLGLLEQSGTEMLSGEAAASPSEEACKYCDFKALCGFDWQLAEKKAQEKPPAKEEIFARLGGLGSE